MALAAGLGEQDTSVLMTVIERIAAVQIPKGRRRSEILSGGDQAQSPPSPLTGPGRLPHA